MARYRHSRNPVLGIVIGICVLIPTIIIFLTQAINTTIENIPENVIVKETTHNGQIIEFRLEDHGEGYTISDNMEISNAQGQKVTFTFTTVDDARKRLQAYDKIDEFEKEYAPGSAMDPQIFPSFRHGASNKSYSDFLITSNGQKCYVCTGQIKDTEIGFYISETITNQNFFNNIMNDLTLTVK